MRIKMTGGPIWFNTMPTIGSAGHSLPSIPLTIDPQEVLPEGTYAVEVTLKGPDGKEHKATAQFTVGHAC